MKYHKNINAFNIENFEDTDDSYLIMKLCYSDMHQLIKKEKFSK